MYIQKIIDYLALHVFIILVPQSKSVFLLLFLRLINSSDKSINIFQYFIIKLLVVYVKIKIFRMHIPAMTQFHLKIIHFSF